MVNLRAATTFPILLAITLLSHNTALGAPLPDAATVSLKTNTLHQRANHTIEVYTNTDNNGNGRPSGIVYVDGENCGTGLVDGVLRLVNGLLNGGARCRGGYRGGYGGGIL
ncbi:hypothetical protein CPC08DRAFT_750942 [Agrocybe pediades]|nr:hypothetical protein CPC08DRAFT_750942 [Agrocybe pediades]